MKTKLLFNREAKDKLLEGVRKLAEAVTLTLGPRGQNVAIARMDPYGNIYERIVVHDGVTVAKSIDLEDEFENMGAQLVKQAAQKQVQDVGDGTTVVILIARAIIEEVNALIVSGMNPMDLRYELEKTVEFLIEEIQKSATPVSTFEQKKYIATVSAEDEELGKLVAETIEMMGPEGLVAVEESKGGQTIIDRQEGMQLDKGFIHPLFITNPDRLEATLENPLILCTDWIIPSLALLKTVVQECADKGKKLVIIAPGIGAEALEALLNNKLRGVLFSLAVEAPSFGQNQNNTLQDIAIFTGGRFITKDAGHKLEDVKMEDLGKAEYVTATKDETIIVGGKGKKDMIETRIAEIRKSIETEDQDFDKEKLKERLAKLTTGIAVIRVGGATEVEMKERLERVKDAVAATKAAVISGIVPGGETIYLKVREKLSKDSTNLIHKVMYKVLYQPFKKLMDNGGLNDGQMYERIKTQHQGVDIRDGQVKNMVKEGIIDPAMVPVEALKNGLSVAIQILTTGAIVIPIKDELPQQLRK